jgi:hypothetical protein
LLDQLEEIDGTVEKGRLEFTLEIDVVVSPVSIVSMLP